MSVRNIVIVAVLTAATGGLIVPALAHDQGGGDPDHNSTMGMSRMGMGHGMMGSGCAGMMQSMNGGGRPNSQWQGHRPGNAAPH